MNLSANRLSWPRKICRIECQIAELLDGNQQLTLSLGSLDGGAQLSSNTIVVHGVTCYALLQSNEVRARVSFHRWRNFSRRCQRCNSILHRVGERRAICETQLPT